VQRIGNRCLRCFPSSAADGCQCVPAQWRWALRAANCAPFRVAVMRLRPLVPVAGGEAPDCALRLPVACGLEWGASRGCQMKGVNLATRGLNRGRLQRPGRGLSLNKIYPSAHV
jgi:hypothetical protein